MSTTILHQIRTTHLEREREREREMYRQYCVVVFTVDEGTAYSGICNCKNTQFYLCPNNAS